MTLLLLAFAYVLFLLFGWALLTGGTRRPDPTVPNSRPSVAESGETAPSEPGPSLGLGRGHHNP